MRGPMPTQSFGVTCPPVRSKMSDMAPTSGMRMPTFHRHTVPREQPNAVAKAVSVVCVVESQQANRMTIRCHRFGDQSSEKVTRMVSSTCRRDGDKLKIMKGKYPNGLREAMERRKIGPTELARQSGTSKQNVDRLAGGKRELTAIWAERLAPALNVSPEELVFPAIKKSRVPLVSWVSAGRLAGQDGIRPGDIKKFTQAMDLPKGDYIALEVSGDSMDRIAPDGATIFVNRADKRLVDNKFYVFTSPEGEATFKRYRAGNPPRLQPFSTNPNNETIFPPEGTTIIGRVRRVIIDID